MAEQGWTGINYSKDIKMDALAKIFRDYCKRRYPDCKFSIRHASFANFSIALMEAPFSPWADFGSQEVQTEIACRKLMFPYHDIIDPAKRGYKSINESRLDSDYLITPEMKALFKDICGFVQSYNCSRVDTTYDRYFINFHATFSIGKADTPFALCTHRKRARAKKAA